MGRRAQQSGEVCSLTEMPEAEHDTGRLAEGCHLAWMMGFMEAFMQQMRALTTEQDDINQSVNESLVHPVHRVESVLGPTPVNRISPALDSILQEAERATEAARAYRENSPSPADEPEVVNHGGASSPEAARIYRENSPLFKDEPEVVNPGTRRRRMIVV